MADALLTIAKWAIIGILIAAVLVFVGFIVWGFTQLIPQVQSVIDTFGAIMPTGVKVAIWAIIAGITLPFAYKIALKLISLF